jgi:endonuclease/exonuclease/phosphatase family metal-dependent hydrolase
MLHRNIDQQIGEGLRVLRNRIEAARIPPSQLDETLTIATWNIREFGKKRRTDAAVHYIADILSQFDLIAIIEVRDNLADLYRVLDILGPQWYVLFSDFNADAQGNRERIAYLYDGRVVTFTGLAAEADPPRTKDRATGEYLPSITWWRSPYMASFRAGNFDFILLAAHIRWGGDDMSSRLPEIKMMADWIDKRSQEKYIIDKDIILLGDFNIPQLDDELFQAITSHGLTIADSLRGTHGSNLAQNKRYDQILHYHRYTRTFTDKGGVLDFYQNDWRPLFPAESYPEMTQDIFTHELSDHLPLWVQIDTWVDDEALDQFLARRARQ